MLEWGWLQALTCHHGLRVGRAKDGAKQRDADEEQKDGSARNEAAIVRAECAPSRHSRRPPAIIDIGHPAQ